MWSLRWPTPINGAGSCPEEIWNSRFRRVQAILFLADWMSAGDFGRARAASIWRRLGDAASTIAWVGRWPSGVMISQPTNPTPGQDPIAGGRSVHPFFRR